MVYFDCDYMTGAHPEILKKLMETNMEHTAGYGYDPYTERAQKLILEHCGIPDGWVEFTQGGTQTNMVMIDRLAPKGEGVLCAETAHINVHESGAIEYSGNKVLPLPSSDGKITPFQLQQYLDHYYADDTWRHMVKPSMVYISYPTELGTLYSRRELSELWECCRKSNLKLYIDGARMAYGLAANKGELTLSDIARCCDAFYIGGTKCGALFGEAIVSQHPQEPHEMLSHKKRHGALLAKGRLLALQFEVLFTDNLYCRLGKHAVDLAEKIQQGLLQKGYRQLFDSPTNQIFFVLPNDRIDALAGIVSFGYWGPRGETESAVRFVTDWSTTEEAVEVLLQSL